MFDGEFAYGRVDCVGSGLDFLFCHVGSFVCFLLLVVRLSFCYISLCESFLSLGLGRCRKKGLEELRVGLFEQILRLLNKHVALTGVASAAEATWVRDFKYLTKTVFINIALLMTPPQAWELVAAFEILGVVGLVVLVPRLIDCLDLDFAHVLSLPFEVWSKNLGSLARLWLL